MKLAPGQEVLDFGTGTASLAIAILSDFPGVRVTGLDIDPRILRVARKKVQGLGLDIRLEQYDGNSLPFEDQAFDCIASSLVFHHLREASRRRVLEECRRVLRPGGQILLADMGRPANWRQYMGFSLIRIIDGLEATRGCLTNALLKEMQDAGFEVVRETGACLTALGTIRYFAGQKPV